MPRPSAAAEPRLSWWARLRGLLRGSATVPPVTEPEAAERYSLKAAVARKRLNDRVRHQELNLLRDAMRSRRQEQERQASSGYASGLSQLSVLPSAFEPSPDPGGGKSRTIEQIARIEAQMARNWVRTRLDPAASSTRIAATPRAQAPTGGLTQATHLRAPPGRRSMLPIDVVTTQPQAGGSELDAALSHPDLTQAAQCFAQNDDERCQGILRALMVQEVDALAARIAGLALLDCFHARNEYERFEEFAAEFAESFGVPVPRWPSPPPQHGSGAVGPPEPTQPCAWSCPLFLDLQAVQQLQQLLASEGPVKWLDWTGLLSADLPAAQALLEVVQGCLQSPIELRFIGSAVLRRRLKASTPSGRSETAPIWWLLRLDLLRTMQRRDEYDLVALDYCVTYGVLPPPWQEPMCRWAAADPMTPAAAATLADDTAGHTLSAVWLGSTSEQAVQRPRLSGTWRAEEPQALAVLDAALQSALSAPVPEPVFVIDCHGLLRLDLAAASALMQWLLAARQRGVALQLDGVSRLVATYLHMLGLDEVATLRLRQY